MGSTYPALKVGLQSSSPGYVTGSGPGSFPRSEITMVIDVSGRDNFFERWESPSVKHVNLASLWEARKAPLPPGYMREHLVLEAASKSPCCHKEGQPN